MTPGGQAPYYLVAMLKFDSMGDIKPTLGAATGLAVLADLGNFATGGVSVLMSDDKAV